MGKQIQIKQDKRKDKRQDKTRQDTRQDQTRQDKTRQDQTRQHKTTQREDKKPCCGIGGVAIAREKRVLPSRAAFRACRDGKEN